MSDEQRTKGIILHAMRRSVMSLWGEAGLSDVARRVSADCRAQTVDVPASPIAWVPERFLIEWHDATFNGPAQNDDAELCRAINKRLDLGFGFVRKTLLGLLGPEDVIRRAQELWKHDHTHGNLQVRFDPGKKSGAATLTDHVFCDAPIARRALTETFRYIIQLSRGVKGSRASHVMQGKALIVRVAWE